MNLVLVPAFFAAMIFTRATSKPETAAPEAFDQRREHDARFYQNAVINQERRLDGLDAAFAANRADVAAKVLYRNWAYGLGSLLVAVDIIGFVVKWTR